MQTVSHLLTTWAGGTKLAQKNQSLSVPWLVLGSVLPDIPFAVLTVGYEIYFRWFAPLPVNNQSIMEYLHFNLFFNDPLWIVSHNFLHSVVVNGVFIFLALTILRRSRWGRVLLWIAVGAMVHTLIDIFTHHSDGPLFLFPINWQYRFASPISYWETAYYGRQFMMFEYAVDLLAILYLVYRRYIRRQVADGNS